MTDPRPNIILVMTDQHRGDCLSVEGGRHPVQTPNLDRLAAQGTRFTNCYATVPICIPARRSLMSGQFPHTHGLRQQGYEREWDFTATLPQALQDAGYHTHLVGRHMHQHPPRKRYGYDDVVFQPDYQEWLAQHLHADTYHDRSTFQMGPFYSTGVMHNDLTTRVWPYADELHNTNWTIHEARRFLERRDPSMPYFLTMSFVAPHPPLLPPQDYLDRYLRMDLPEPVIGEWAEPPGDDDIFLDRGSDVGRRKADLSEPMARDFRAAYYASINHVDDQIRRVLYNLGGVDMSNTIVVFTADHGDMMGDHYFYAKALPYQGSVRIPLIVRTPPRYELPTGVVDTPVCLEDVMPTILDLAGVDIPDTVQGASVTPLMESDNATWSREHLHLQYEDFWEALTDGRAKYIRFADGREQLFDLVADPDERNDLAEDATMTDTLAHWRVELEKELARL